MIKADSLVNALYFSCISALLCLCSCSKKTEPVKQQETAFTWEVTATGVPHYYLLDQLPGIAQYEGKTYMLGGAGAMWNSFTDPAAFNAWAMRKGNNIDDLQLQAQPKMVQDFPDQHTEGNDWCFYWLMGLWIDPSSGTFYSVAYSEYNYLNGWETEAKERRMGLAISLDKGLTWRYQGDIITQDKSTPPPAGQQYYGAGDLSLLIPGDGYVYVYYKKGFYSLTTLNRSAQDICVARCLLSDKFAPGKWHKFYNGAWAEAGLGGKETIVIPYVNIANVAYNEYLKKYVCIGNAVSGKTFIAFADSMEKQNWTERDFSFPDITHHYNWQVNTTDNNPYTMGQTFRLYTCGLDITTTPHTKTGKYYTIKFIKK